MTETFWKYFKEYERRLSDIEKKIMEHDFDIFMKGNSDADDASAPEMKWYFFIFKSGWIAAEMKRMQYDPKEQTQETVDS